MECIIRFLNCNSEWSRESLLEAWMEDPITACERAGVTQLQGINHFIIEQFTVLFV